MSVWVDVDEKEMRGRAVHKSSISHSIYLTTTGNSIITTHKEFRFLSHLV